jgi:hypothetical protein
VATVFCCVTYPDRTGFNTIAGSLFEAGANALRWAEVDCQIFGSARRFRDDQTLVIGVGMVPDRLYRVKVGRVREWSQNGVDLPSQSAKWYQIALRSP